MMDEQSVMVPDIEIGKKLIRACNENLLLDSTTNLNSLSVIELPAEFRDKLDFDVNRRFQFDGHPLAPYANGGLEGFCKRLTKIYTALVARKIETGYSGAIMGLWNQDLVYILAELLCYTDDVMAVRVGLALEELALSEAIIDENTEILIRLLRLKCPRLCNHLDELESLQGTALGLYRSCCTTLLARTFAGRPVLPKLWKITISKQSLLPIMRVLCILMGRCEDRLLASLQAGKGVKEVDAVLSDLVNNMSETAITELTTECLEAVEGHEASAHHHLAAMPTGAQMEESSAKCMKLFYPLAYGHIPEWSRADSVPPPTLVVQIIVTVLWVLVVTALVFQAAWQFLLASQELVDAFLIAVGVVLFPNVPLILMYRVKDGTEPVMFRDEV